ncbi:MAG TPA: hypothetical protein VMD75_00345 [Candidatus Binataceae bacterium]|nr:hypothetical protein [Candidatus Binataceae bacterium]
MSIHNWQMIDALASVVSAWAIVAGAVFVIIELRQAKTDRNFAISSHLFELWQSSDFQADQLFLLHKLPPGDWNAFIELGRGDHAERALHRVGGFYDRVGHLVLKGLIKQEDILPTIGGDAVAVWSRIEPLVQAARRQENPFLFKNYEAVLPSCIECIYPNFRPVADSNGADIAGSESAPAALAEPEEEMGRIEPRELFDLMRAGEATVLDVSAHENPERIQGAIRAVPNDLRGWLKQIPATDRLVGLYCT